MALADRKAKIVDTALEFGFESHEAFTRSFKRRFGLSPFQYKKTGRLPHYLLKRPLTLEYLQNLQQRIADAVEEIRIGPLCLRGYRTSGNDPVDVLNCWSKLRRRLLPVMTGEPPMYGVIQYEDTEQPDLSYSYFAAAPQERVRRDKGQQEQVLPASTYVVFHHKGSVDLLPLTYRYVYGTWLPRNGRLPHSPYDFECYDERFTGPDDPNSVVRICIPVIAR